MSGSQHSGPIVDATARTTRPERDPPSHGRRPYSGGDPELSLDDVGLTIDPAGVRASGSVRGRGDPAIVAIVAIAAMLFATVIVWLIIHP